jgi:CelD/BcsL family acetyltransferase involved in cellulose biosynthesis
MTAFVATASNDWPATRARWAGFAPLTTCTPFQTVAWLDAWYTSHAGLGEPLLIDVMQGNSVAALLAFVMTRRGSQGVLEFADLGVSDFNAPILGPAAPKCETGARALWQAVVAALPPVDLIDLRKMPLAVGGRANPLALLERLPLSPLVGHLIPIPDWDAYHAALDRRVRMEFERCWRVFQRSAGARFVRVRDEVEALVVLDSMDRQQRARLEEMGQEFRLDRPVERALYRHDLGPRLAAGTAIVTALMDGPDVVASLYAISDGETPVLVRLANAGGGWRNASPGRLIVHRTLHHLAAEGFKRCDLGIGDYDYKRRLDPIKTPLLDLIHGATWRGRALELRHRAVATLRQHPQLETRLRRLLGKPDPATGRIPDAKKPEA